MVRSLLCVFGFLIVIGKEFRVLESAVMKLTIIDMYYLLLFKRTIYWKKGQNIKSTPHLNKSKSPNSTSHSVIFGSLNFYIEVVMCV